jgi:hypothetical protein
LTGSGAPCSSGVLKMPGRIVLTRISSRRQVAGDRQGHADNAALGSGVGGLADLAIFSSHRSGVDDCAALAVDRVQRHHAGGGFRDAAERADQVDLDDQVELIEREVADFAGFLVAAGRLDGVAGAGAVDQDALLADCGAGFFERGIDAGVVGDVTLAEHAAQFLGEGFAFFRVEVEQGNLHAIAGQLRRRCSAESGGATGDDSRNIRIEFHGPRPSLVSDNFSDDL